MGLYRKIRTTILLSIVLMILSSCENVAMVNLESLFEADSITSEIEYAVGFDVYKNKDITKLVIYVPGEESEVLATYFLTTEEIDNKYSNASNVIVLPVDSFAVFSATQLNAYYILGQLDKVVAISESDFIQNKDILKLYQEGKIVNLASNGNFFLERALEVNPEIVFYSPWNMAQRHPLAETKLKLIPFFDFKETSPLGRAEWIKFTALFTGMEKHADSIFNGIVEEYENYKSLTSNIKAKPTVLSDKYYSGQWFVPGGRSYIAQLFEDAGAEYIWRDNENTASFNLDFEVVFKEAHNADFWRIVGHYDMGFSYNSLLAENELYANFKAFNERNVIFCDSRKSTYFETGTLEPQVVLADLIHAFHPELLPDYVPVYYKHYR